MVKPGLPVLGSGTCFVRHAGSNYRSAIAFACRHRRGHLHRTEAKRPEALAVRPHGTAHRCSPQLISLLPCRSLHVHVHKIVCRWNFPDLKGQFYPNNTPLATSAVTRKIWTLQECSYNSTEGKKHILQTSCHNSNAITHQHRKSRSNPSCLHIHHPSLYLK